MSHALTAPALSLPLPGARRALAVIALVGLGVVALGQVETTCTGTALTEADLVLPAPHDFA